MVRAREPLITNVIGMTDGLRLEVKCNESPEAQALAYNFLSGTTNCNNILTFSPTGKVIHCVLNAPGSWHDSQACIPLIRLCLATIAGFFALCVDQGFPRSGELLDVFLGPMSKKTRRALAPLLREALVRRCHALISLRQASEWGMRSLQGSFSRLKTRLTEDSEVREKLIYSIVLLHNFRTEKVGINQIAKVFDPNHPQYINISGYQRLHRYYRV